VSDEAVLVLRGTRGVVRSSFNDTRLTVQFEARVDGSNFALNVTPAEIERVTPAEVERTSGLESNPTSAPYPSALLTLGQLSSWLCKRRLGGLGRTFPFSLSRSHSHDMN